LFRLIASRAAQLVPINGPGFHDDILNTSATKIVNVADDYHVLSRRFDPTIRVITEPVPAMPTPRLHMFAKFDRGAAPTDAPAGRRLVVFPR
jgi:hypothetical protein